MSDGSANINSETSALAKVKAQAPENQEVGNSGFTTAELNELKQDLGVTPPVNEKGMLNNGLPQPAGQEDKSPIFYATLKQYEYLIESYPNLKQKTWDARKQHFMALFVQMSISESLPRRLDDKKPSKPGYGATGSRKKKKQLAARGELEQTEQAFLMQNIDKIPYADQAPKAWDLARLNLVNTKENLLNKLTSSRKMLSLMGASSSQLAALTPYIKLAKRYKIGGEERVKEFKFSSESPELEAYFSQGTSAGSEVGLKSFEFETTGTNFFTASRSLRGTMVLFFKSMADLDALPLDDNLLPWTELLFNKVFTQQTEFQRSFVPEKDRDKTSPAEIFVELGYNFSDNALEDQDLREAVNDSKILLSIYPTNTEFDFRDDGAVELSISFIAAAEMKSDTSVSNVLTVGIDKETNKAIEEARTNLKNLQTIDLDKERRNERKGVEAKIKTQEEKLAKLVERRKFSNYARFINFVFNKGRLYSFTVSEDDYRKGVLPAAGLGEVVVRQQNINELIEKAQTEDLKGKGLETKKRKRGERTIAYFYLGDLINYYAQSLIDFDEEWGLSATEGTDEPLLKQKMEVVIGDYVFFVYPNASPPETDDEVKNFIDGVETRRINLSQLPISLSMFNVFMYDVVMKHQSAIMTFDTFIKKAVVQLIDNAVSSTTRGRKWDKLKKSFVEKRLPMSITNVSGIAEGLYSNRREQYEPNAPKDLDNIPNLQYRYEIKSVTIDEIISGAASPKNFLIVHGSRVPVVSATAEFPVGKDEEQDAQQGIYHLSPGLETGIVKNINFSQITSRLKEVNLLKALEDGTSPGVGLLKLPYDAEVRIFGNPSLHPGQYVVLNPATVGVGDIASRRSIAAQLGLGGLYVILTVSTRLSSGVLESTLSCKFNNFSPESPTNDVQPGGIFVSPSVDTSIGTA